MRLWFGGAKCNKLSILNLINNILRLFKALYCNVFSGVFLYCIVLYWQTMPFSGIKQKFYKATIICTGRKIFIQIHRYINKAKHWISLIIYLLLLLQLLFRCNIWRHFETHSVYNFCFHWVCIHCGKFDRSLEKLGCHLELMVKRICLLAIKHPSYNETIINSEICLNYRRNQNKSKQQATAKNQKNIVLNRIE